MSDQPITVAGYVEPEPDFVERWGWYYLTGALSTGFMDRLYISERIARHEPDLHQTNPEDRGSPRVLIRVMIPTSQIRKALES